MPWATAHRPCYLLVGARGGAKTKREVGSGDIFFLVVLLLLLAPCLLLAIKKHPKTKKQLGVKKL
jgi:hypothetical protein